MLIDMDKTNLRQKFRQGAVPSQQDFYDVFESFWHKEEQIPPDRIGDDLLRQFFGIEQAFNDAMDRLNGAMRMMDEYRQRLADMHKKLDEQDERIYAIELSLQPEPIIPIEPIDPIALQTE